MRFDHTDAWQQTIVGQLGDRVTKGAVELVWASSWVNRTIAIAPANVHFDESKAAQPECVASP